MPRQIHVNLFTPKQMQTTCWMVFGSGGGGGGGWTKWANVLWLGMWRLHTHCLVACDNLFCVSFGRIFHFVFFDVSQKQQQQQQEQRHPPTEWLTEPKQHSGELCKCTSLPLLSQKKNTNNKFCTLHLNVGCWCAGALNLNWIFGGSIFLTLSFVVSSEKNIINSWH